MGKIVAFQWWYSRVTILIGLGIYFTCLLFKFENPRTLKTFPFDPFFFILMLGHYVYLWGFVRDHVFASWKLQHDCFPAWAPAAHAGRIFGLSSINKSSLRVLGRSCLDRSFWDDGQRLTSSKCSLAVTLQSAFGGHYCTLPLLEFFSVLGLPFCLLPVGIWRWKIDDMFLTLTSWVCLHGWFFVLCVCLFCKFFPPFPSS